MKKPKPKMGRPKLPQGVMREKVRKIRLNGEEDARVMERAAVAGQPVSAFMREKALNG